MSELSIEYDGYRPGALGDVVRLHADYYSEAWGFGRGFEAMIAQELGEIFSTFQEERDHACFAYWGGRAIGSIVIDGRPSPEAGRAKAARLRFIILDRRFLGRGIGHKLVGEAVAWADTSGYRHLWLTTFEGLDAARRLYEAVGFTLTRAYPGETYGRPLTEQRFDRFS